ncbi:hypothetical protein JCM3766R1_000327 [Sporobolomyces carnicolor]
MSSTAFAVQPIPPFNPAKHRKNLPPFSSISQIDALSSPSSASPAPAPSEDDQNVRRYSTAATMAGSAYPSVFEIPNPHRKSNSFTRHELESVDKGLSEVHEEDRTSENNPNGKKRRAIEELERDGGGSTDTSSRRSSKDVLLRRVLMLSRGISRKSHGIRASFSFPANPHPQFPSSYPQVTSIPSPPARNCPSPTSHAAGSRLPEAADRTSPMSSKRARNAHGPLDSLAATATDLLSSSSASASASAASSPSTSATQTPPATAASSIASLIGPPSDARSKQHQTALESNRTLKEQQEREIERRRIALGGPSANQPAVGSVQAALGRLKGPDSVHHHHQPKQQRSVSQNHERENGLAKRRGHRPPAVSTNSFPPASATVAVTSEAMSYDDARRGAPPGLPSVLVGSPVDATWAARMAKDARGTGPSSISTNSSQHYRSESTSTPAVNEVPSSSSHVRDPQSHSRARSSFSIPSGSHPRGHSHQPPSSHLMSASQSRDRHPPAPAASSAPTPSPSTTQAYPFPHAHSHAIAPSPSYDRNQGSGTRLPPLNSMNLRTGPSHHHPPHPVHHQASMRSQQLPPSPPPQSASKQAFLSLFSTFFDSLQDSKVLTTTLDHQISRSAALLATLQQSEAALERLVDRKLDDVERRSRVRLDDIERNLVGRLERIEQVVFEYRGSQNKEIGGGVRTRLGRLATVEPDAGPAESTTTATTTMTGREGRVGLGIIEQPAAPPSPPSFFERERGGDDERRERNLLDRVDKLERLLVATARSDDSSLLRRGDRRADRGGEHGESEVVVEVEEEDAAVKSLPTPQEDKRGGVYARRAPSS